MRFHEFLIEALEGQKAQRGEFIKKQLGPNWRGLPGYTDMDAFIDKLGEIDPSQKGIYMPWIARLAMKNPDQNKTEDLERLGQDLRNFEQFKAQLDRKDINQYKSFGEVFDAIEPFTRPKKKTAAEKKAERELAKKQQTRQDIIDVYNGPEGWVKIPTSKDAATYLGQNTRWCTAAKKHNMFDSYNKSDKLFVIYDKDSKERFQLHIDSGQFMDVQDRSVSKDKIPEWGRSPIVNWYRKNNPELSMKQMMFLSNWAEDNIAAGTEHEELMDLMRKYGI